MKKLNKEIRILSRCVYCVYLSIFTILINLIYLPVNNYAHNYDKIKGSITIDANQDRVDVYINNEYYGTASGPSVIEDLIPGRYLIN